MPIDPHSDAATEALDDLDFSAFVQQDDDGEGSNQGEDEVDASGIPSSPPGYGIR